MNDRVVVRVQSLSIQYGKSQPVREVEFECSDGEFVVLVGKSGSGKSSFLNALAGFIPYEGRIDVTGRLGYVFQSNALFPWMTVEGNIGFGLEGVSRGERKRRVEELLERIEMEGFAGRYPHQLSGGQIQRVALARALAPEPEVLLMDEPYAALDYHSRERMQSWLLSIWKDSRKTVIFVTHLLEEAIFLADRILVLRDGQFKADIQVRFARPRSEDLRLSEQFLDVKKEILDHLG